MGSLLLSRNNQRWLKLLFYILAALQLVTFGVIKIRDDVVAWCVIGGSLSLVMVGLYVFSLQSKEVAVDADKRVYA